MPTTVLINNPLVDPRLINYDVVVNYDTSKDRFYVTFVATNSGYYVERGELVDEFFKYTNSIMDKILEGCETDEELDVVFTSRAINEVNMIWMANCDIF